MNAILALVLRLILILLAYTFIGWIGYLIFTDLRGVSLGQRRAKIPPIELRAITSLDLNEKIFVESKITLGRDPSSDFPLDDETISLKHCQVAFHDKQWWVEDLNSTNGSFLNGILIDSPAVITNGDIIRLGQVEISVKLNKLEWRLK